MNTAEQIAVAWILKGNLRPTKQRRALATLLVGDQQDRHVTAESLHEAARNAGESVSLATVYNSLRQFSDAGLLNEINIDGGRNYFDTRTDDHPHFYWEGSGDLHDAPTGSVTFADLPSPPEGAEIARVDVVLRLREK